jgi:type IV pilus assembly protein PilQ
MALKGSHFILAVLLGITVGCAAVPPAQPTDPDSYSDLGHMSPDALIDHAAERAAAERALATSLAAIPPESIASAASEPPPVDEATDTPRLDEWAPSLVGPDGDNRQQLIDVQFDQLAVGEALQLLAVMAEQNVIAMAVPAIAVSLNLRQVSWRSAFNALLSLGDLVVREADGIVWVTASEKAVAMTKRQALVTRTFEMNHARAVDVAAFLNRAALRPLQTTLALDRANASTLKKSVKPDKPSAGAVGKGEQSEIGNLRGLLSPRGVVLADARTNQLFVSEIPTQMAAVSRLVVALDRPVQQVLIQARIVEVDDGFSQTLGVRLGAGLSRDLVNPAAVDLPAGGLAGRSAATLALALYRPGVARFINVELSALETSGRGKIIARPSIVTANLVKALIEQGTEYPYQTQNADGLGTVQFRKASLKLEVTPRITPNGQVMLSVSINKDSRGETTAQGVAINTKHVETQVLVENAGTVVIGGIFERYDRGDDTKVPFLGDLPGLGVLFRSRSQRADKSEMLIFLTPYILRADGEN